jgi:outer membrane lipase/esterase
MTGALTSVFPLPPAPGGTLFTTENYADPLYGVSMLRSGTSLSSQVNQFLTSSPTFDSDSTLFLVWAGANDLFFSPQPSTVQSALDNIAAALVSLVDAGAENILVPGLPNLALTPAIRELDAANPGFNIAEGYRDLSLGFNQGLGVLLTALSSQLQPLHPNLQFFPFDVNKALLDVIANPAALGLINVTQACNDVTFTTTCADPANYLFWDPVHPTDVVHAELGRQFAAAVEVQVPEPDIVVLLVMAAAALSSVRVTRRRIAANNHS